MTRKRRVYGRSGRWRQRTSEASLTFLAFLALPTGATAAVFDEFEVHGTDISPEGVRTTDLFLSYGLRGTRTPSYHGALANDRGFYITPLLGYGVSSWWETAVLLPTAIDRQGRFSPGGVKFHNVVVLPHRADEAWTFGAVLELSVLSRRFQPRTFTWEIRPLAMYRSGRWTGRLTLGFIGGFGGQTDGIIAPAASLSWAMSERFALGLEHYAELGRVERLEPLARQAHQLFATAQFLLGPVGVNAGLGRGLTPASDRWVLKAHLSYPF